MATDRPRHAFRFEAIGTAWTIELFDQVDPSKLRALERDVNHLIAGFDRAYSRFRPDSIVATASKSPGTYRFPPSFGRLMSLYRTAYELSAGKVTPLIGGVLADAGYDATYSLTPKALHRPPAWDDVMRTEGSDLITTSPVRLDFGAAGKGMLVDLVADRLRRAGLLRYLVDAGGDMRYEDDSSVPLEIGLEHPDDGDQVIGIVRLAGGALCGSAGNRRAWAGYTHIFDPDTLDSARAVKAVWVAAPTAAEADMLTTVLSFVPPERARDAVVFEYAVVMADNSFVRSPGFPATFFNEASS